MLRWLIKKVYALVPFKQPAFVALKRMWHPPEQVWRHLHFNGTITVPLEDANGSILLEHRGSISENVLFWSGLDGWYERKSIALWLKLVRSASVILDVGANSGLYALLAAKVNPTAKVVAFEPVPETFAWLQQNISLNALEIQAEALAASDTNGSAEIWFESAGSHYSPSLFQATRQPVDEGVRINVRTIALDEFFAQQGLERVDLMKIDVEFHEPEVLRGMRHLLDRCRPAMLIEVLDDDTGERIERELSGLGYLYFNIHEPSGAVRRVERITKSDTYNYLCIQPSQLTLAGLDA